MKGLPLPGMLFRAALAVFVMAIALAIVLGEPRSDADLMFVFKGYVVGALGALKASIEARDFRLDEHGRRLTELESSR